MPVTHEIAGSNPVASARAIQTEPVRRLCFVLQTLEEGSIAGDEQSNALCATAGPAAHRSALGYGGQLPEAAVAKNVKIDR